MQNEQIETLSENELTEAVGAVLFAAGAPVSASEISAVFDVSDARAEEIISILSKKLTAAGIGLEIRKLDDSYQMCTEKKHGDYVRAALHKKRNQPLSKAALEVISIIAYKQPVTKTYIEQIRGVDSSGIVDSLCQKGLVSECGRLNAPGRPILFATTSEFLRVFGLEKLSDLPSLPSERDALFVTEEDDQLSGQMIIED